LWILENDDVFLAFFAGLIDAEGSFFIERSKQSGCFAIGMTDKLILEQCREKLVALGIRCASLLLSRRPTGEADKYGITLRKDYWQFQIKAKESLTHLITLLEPRLKHAKRRADMQRVKENVEWRQSVAFREVVKQRHRKPRN